MATYYYSTQPFLAWCFNHYFYGQEHWTFVAEKFYPYRLPNPPTSNPFTRYKELYEHVIDDDPFAAIIMQKRQSLGQGVLAKHRLFPSLPAFRLQHICRNIQSAFFYPVVYRVDLDTIRIDRLKVAGSGKSGSKEYLIEDLQETEFDLLFADFYEDTDCMSLLSGTLSQQAVLHILIGRC